MGSSFGFWILLNENKNNVFVTEYKATSLFVEMLICVGIYCVCALPYFRFLNIYCEDHLF